MPAHLLVRSLDGQFSQFAIMVQRNEGLLVAKIAKGCRPSQFVTASLYQEAPLSKRWTMVYSCPLGGRLPAIENYSLPANHKTKPFGIRQDKGNQLVNIADNFGNIELVEMLSTPNMAAVHEAVVQTLDNSRRICAGRLRPFTDATLCRNGGA